LTLFNPEEIQLKVGLEVHQQLATKTKLFCGCEEFDEETFEYSITRRLRPAQSELGEIDPAARFEFTKGFTIKYRVGRNSSCLVEVDEEPPHPLNMEAVETALIIALTLRAQPIDELHVMRKMVIDGSNTTGFQRTLIVALGGELKFSDRAIPVQTISLEEDAARLIGESEGVREYALDRLCVPLVEVALAPITGTPREIQEVALALGRLMRSTRRVSRGLGTIRQDVNISILGGEVVEVKGVQKLDLLEKVVEFEAVRQLSLMKIRDELMKRGLKPEDYTGGFIDVTEVFQKTDCTILKRIMNRGEVIVAAGLKGFSGLLSYEPYPGVRFGKELADVVRLYGIRGLFHSDELPDYGINQLEVVEVRRRLNLGEGDSFLIIAGGGERLKQACEAVTKRIQDAFKGVPAETRGPTPDGKTRFIRPRPGAARMYPETDIPPIPISEEYIERLKREVPRPWEEQVEEYISKYHLSEKLALQIYDSPYCELFKELAEDTSVPPGFIAATLTESLINLAREGFDTTRITDETLRSIFTSLDRGRISKEAVPRILEAILRGEVRSVEEAAEKLGLKSIRDEELIEIVRGVLEENRRAIEEKGEHAFGLLMGRVMSVVRGSVDGRKVSTTLKAELEKMLSQISRDLSR